MRKFPLLLIVAALVAPGAARAQLMLPGALQAQPPDAAAAPQGPAAAAPLKPKLAELKPPSIETILGRELSRNGSAGLINFQTTPEKGLEITKLSLSGEEISNPSEPCLVDVVAEEPIVLKFSGRPNGLARYSVDIKACPFSLEVLDGAILVTRSPTTCDFSAAQCRVALPGLWGPQGKSFGPDQAKQFERDRARAEADMRTNFRALIKKAGKDKEAVKKIAGEQAGFSSVREMTCRTYLNEDVHGFCALRLTQARTAALQAALIGSSGKTDSSPAKAQDKSTIAKRKHPAQFAPIPTAGPNGEPHLGPPSATTSK